MSTKEQMRGDSWERQKRLTDAFVERERLELVEKFNDIGIPAFLGQNTLHGRLGVFLRMVEAGEVPKGSYFIIESMDRLTRQAASTAVMLLTQIINSGIVVVTLDDGMKYSVDSLAENPYALMIALGAMTRAHDESKRKSNLVSSAWQGKRNQLRATGLILTATVPAWLSVDKQRNEILVREERAAVVREIFALACAGYGIYSIAKMLNERGERAWGTRKSAKGTARQGAAKATVWRDSYIKKILTSRSVLGEFQPHRISTTSDGTRIRVADGDPIPNYYPAIVEPSTFREAALAMDRRRLHRRGRKGLTYSNLLTGLLRCGQCDSGVRYLDKGSAATSKYLRCSTSLAGGPCSTKSYKYQAVESTLIAALDTLDVAKVLGGDMYGKRLVEKKREREIALSKKEGMELSVKSLNDALEQTTGVQPKSTVERILKLEEGIESLEKQLQRLDAELDELTLIDPKKKAEVVASLLNAVRDDEDSSRLARSRRALAGELQRMIERVVISPLQYFEHELEVNDTRHSTEAKGEARDRAFELRVVYRNGQIQVIDGAKQRSIKIKASQGSKDMRTRAMLKALSHDQ